MDSIDRYTPPAGNGRVIDIFRHAREAPVLSKSRVMAVCGIPMRRLILYGIYLKKLYNILSLY